MRGKVFDIRRFSTHDGCGIRTTVFLKGCTLCCVWCQNPEGISGCTRPVFFEGKCIRCGTCLKHTVQGGIYIKDGKICLNQSRNDDWLAITDACPSRAIVMDSQIYEPEELVNELLKDEVFFRRGGGVTLSGGEPFSQPGFAVDILRLLHERGIHTAVETALNVSAEIVCAALPYLDLVYADMKLADEQKHKTYTGVSNALIKQNLAKILTGPERERVIIRTPLIPSITATEENLGEIASFLSTLYPQVKYELLNYNPLAEAKYHLVGRSYCFKENPKPYAKARMEEFGSIVTANGIKNLIMEIP